MAQVSLVKMQSGALAPLCSDDQTIIEKMRIGSVIECKFKTMRNPLFHRKFFALLSMGFDYWQPTGGTIAPSERKLIENFVKKLAEYGGNAPIFLELASQYLDHVSAKRADIETEKSFEAYRKWVISEAGFYSIIVLPNGTTRKEAQSIRFAKMDDAEFAELYKAAFNVLWTYVLSQHFDSQEQANAVVDRLLGYA